MDFLATIEKHFVEGSTSKLVITVPNKLAMIERKGIQHIGISVEDERRITPEQRRKAYATIKDIADWQGDMPEATKEYMKAMMMIRTGCEHFSLSNCSVDTAREYINTLIDFCLENGVALTDSAISRTDDISRYLYSCIMNKRCAICGRDGEIHHCEGSRIGMGNDRRRVSNDGRELICLCRIHHNELHNMAESEFFKKYHVYGLEVRTIG